jgi:hypothetical protein
LTRTVSSLASSDLSSSKSIEHLNYRIANPSLSVEFVAVDCFKVSLSPADDERLSVSSSRQRVSLVTRQSLTRSEWVPCISFGSALPTQCISFGWEPFDRKSPKSNKTTQKPGIFGTMLSFTDGLVSSGSVWIRCFGVHCGKPKWDC